MKTDVLSATEKLTLLSVLEKLFHVTHIDHFMDWVDFDLKPVFPHKTFVCGFVNIRERPIVVQRLLHRNFPLEFFDHFRQPGGLISTPCMRKWAKEGEPQLYEPEHKAEA